MISILEINVNKTRYSFILCIKMSGRLVRNRYRVRSNV